MVKIYKISEENLKTFIEWGKVLETRKEEVSELLSQENCYREMFRFFTIENQNYIVGEMEGENFNSPIDSDLNIEHKRLMKSLSLEPIKSQIIYDIKGKKYT
jgi:hypothetical protein